MDTKSSPCDLKIKRSIKTAIIYSIDDIFCYLVEIKEGDESYFICDNNNEPIKFGNMESARLAALEKKAQEAYLALSKTYEENDLTTCHATHAHYDYTPVPLRLKT